MALLRSEHPSSQRWLGWALPCAGLLVLVLAAFVSGLAFHRPVLRIVAVLLWVGLLAPLVAWATARRLHRRRSRRGVLRVGQWVRCAKVLGGQIDGLAAVRAGGPLRIEQSVTGWLVLEREQVGFRPDPAAHAPETAWSVPWESISVVDVRATGEAWNRLLPGLGRSVVTLRFRGRWAELNITVEDDVSSLLRAWQWYGVGERVAGARRADR